MSEPDEVSSAAPEGEPIGDMGDQGQRLQAVEEQEALDSALGREVDDDNVVIDAEYLQRLTSSEG